MPRGGAMLHDQLADYEYIKNAIERIKTGEISSDSGSHIMGVFGKAASKFEKMIRAELSRLLVAWGLDYDRDLRNLITGGPKFKKLTLGQCCAALKEAARLRPRCASDLVHGQRGFEDMLRSVSEINDAWVEIKHDTGKEVAVLRLIAGLESIFSVWQLFGER